MVIVTEIVKSIKYVLFILWYNPHFVLKFPQV